MSRKKDEDFWTDVLKQIVWQFVTASIWTFTFSVGAAIAFIYLLLSGVPYKIMGHEYFLVFFVGFCFLGGMLSVGILWTALKVARLRSPSKK